MKSKRYLSHGILRGAICFCLALMGMLLFATDPARLISLKRPSEDFLFFGPSRSPLSPRKQALSSGTAYYVDASLGNDLNSGLTPSAPWKTIHKVNTSAFSPGDSILLKRGETWREQLTVPTSGSPRAAITYASYGIGERPIINGAAVAANWTLESRVIWKKTFAVTPSICIDNGVHPTNLHWDRDAAKTFSGATAGCYAIDAANKTVYVWCAADADPNTHTMQVSAAGTNPDGIQCSKSYVHIDGLAVKYASQHGIRVLPAASDIVTGITIQNCAITLCGAYGMRIYNENNPGNTHTLTGVNIIRNTVSYCRKYGIEYEGNTHDCLAQGNTVSYCGWMNEHTGSSGYIGMYAGGYDAAEQTDNIIFDGNIVHHQYENVNGSGPEGACMMFDEFSTNCIARHNTLYSGQSHGLTDNNTSDCQYYDNIIFGCGTLSEGGASINSSKRTIFHHNIVCGNSGYGMQTAGGSTMNGVVIRDNIFLDNGGDTEVWFYGTTNSRITSDFNYICHTEGGRFMKLNTTPYNWADWKANSGQDAHSLNTNPLFLFLHGHFFGRQFRP